MGGLISRDASARGNRQRSGAVPTPQNVGGSNPQRATSVPEETYEVLASAAPETKVVVVVSTRSASRSSHDLASVRSRARIDRGTYRELSHSQNVPDASGNHNVNVVSNHELASVRSRTRLNQGTYQEPSHSAHVLHANGNNGVDIADGNHNAVNAEDVSSTDKAAESITLEDVPRNQLECPIELLKGGIVPLAKLKDELTILLVGETGVGKTSILSLFANVLAGRRPEDYVDAHDATNEGDAAQKGSQTSYARFYEYRSRNGVTLRLLDTPGLADTRGLAHDARHKQSIADAIRAHITTVDAVLILANGTMPRLSVATDYALTTLMSIFPRSLANNIGILFTNVSSPLSWNFDQESIPDGIAHAIQFHLNNPVAMERKLREIVQRGTTPQRTLDMLRRSIERGEATALQTLLDLFHWLSELEPQHTKDILSLFEQTQIIESSIADVLSRINASEEQRRNLARIEADIDKASVTMNTYENFTQVIHQKVLVQVPTDYHNTLCGGRPDCHSNCHVRCKLDFTLDPAGLHGCFAMQPSGHTCRVCGHPRDTHSHFNRLWKEETRSTVVVDRKAKGKFERAGTEKERKEAMRDVLKAALEQTQHDIDNLVQELGRLAREYANMALSGSFASQVEKSVQLLELTLETMRGNGTSRETIRAVEKSLEELDAQLTVLKQAQGEVSEEMETSSMHNGVEELYHTARVMLRP